MSTAETYVAAAYVVVVVAVLAYVAIISAKLARMERQLDELEMLPRTRSSGDDGEGFGDAVTTSGRREFSRAEEARHG